MIHLIESWQSRIKLPTGAALYKNARLIDFSLTEILTAVRISNRDSDGGDE